MAAAAAAAVVFYVDAVFFSVGLVMWALMVKGRAVTACGWCGGGFDEVNEAAEDGELALQFRRIDEGFAGYLDEVEACKLENDDGDINCVGGLSQCRFFASELGPRVTVGRHR